MNRIAAKRILIANDQEWAGRSIESILVANGYNIDRAYTGEQAIKVAGLTRPDLVILDLQLPDFDGLEACRRLRVMPEVGPGVPLLITTASVSGRQRPIEALAAGAWDFFSQPLDGELLLLKIRTYLEAKDQADGARAAGALDTEAGVYSPAGLTIRVREAAAQAHRRGRPLSCVAMRPEAGVEAVEETTFGRVQSMLANGLRRAARSADAVGRGRDLTFFVVAPDTGREGVSRMADRLSSAVASRIGDADLETPLRFRTGCAVMDPASDDGEELLRQAEAALAAGRPSAGLG